MPDDQQATAETYPTLTPIDVCPVCRQPGQAALRPHGAGTEIVHPGRGFPCTTSAVLSEVGSTIPG